MDKSQKNKIKDLFFKVKEVYESSSIINREVTTALRIENIINSNALEYNLIDPIFFYPALYRGNIRVKEFSNPAYRKVYLEVKSHDKMLRFLEDRAFRKIDLTASLLLKIHRLLFEDSWADIAGRFRVIDVRIRGVKHHPPHYTQVHEIIYQHLTWIDGLLKLIGPVNHNNFFEIFHVAADVQRRLIQTYPFRAGNWRIARALSDYIFLYSGMSYNIIDLNSHQEYLTAINKATITDFSDLEELMLENYGKTLKRLENFTNLVKQTPEMT